MSPITTHVLDVSRGLPAKGVGVKLERRDGTKWTTVAEDLTDSDGRAKQLMDDGAPLELGTYRLTFKTADYFKTQKLKTFYPVVELTFEVADTRHHHVPLLLSPFGYTTYRGS